MIISADEASVKKWGKLRIRDPQSISTGSHKRIVWVCDCGRECSREIRHVLNGRSSDCRSCSTLPASYFVGKKFGKLRLKVPEALQPQSDRKVVWICDCGKESYKKVAYVLSDGTESCGQCSIMVAEQIGAMKWGKLRLLHSRDFKPKSNQRVQFICDCGRISIKMFRLVYEGSTRSCGMCNAISSYELADRMFGRISMVTPEDIRPNSDKKVEWLCSCGAKFLAFFHNVYRGLTKSCGHCRNSVQEWWICNRDALRALRSPVHPLNIPPGGPVFLDTARTKRSSVRVLCGACKQEYHSTVSRIVSGHGLTCGCSTNRMSMGQRELTEFVRSLGVEVVSEHKVGGLKFDLFVPSKNLVIEYNGVRWHSGRDARARDASKRRVAMALGLRVVVLFEDEWKLRRHKVEAFLRNLVGVTRPTSVRPSKCELRPIPGSEANAFYEEYHYIGRCTPRVSYGLFLDGRIVACASFGHPTRQTSKHGWELLRMASCPDVRVHGGWSKLLDQFVKDHRPASIVSFSDNRLFDGSVYRAIGFVHDGDVSPDYFWVRGGRRFHKSGLRKPPGHVGTETALRESEGYVKLWDCGKRRWVYRPCGQAVPIAV